MIVTQSLGTYWKLQNWRPNRRRTNIDSSRYPNDSCSSVQTRASHFITLYLSPEILSFRPCFHHVYENGFRIHFRSIPTQRYPIVSPICDGRFTRHRTRYFYNEKPRVMCYSLSNNACQSNNNIVSKRICTRGSDVGYLRVEKICSI